MMLVLDTHAWLWWVHDPSRLSKPGRRAIAEAEKTDGILVSTISVWEVAVKTMLGKLTLNMDINEWYRQAAGYPNLVVEPLDAADAIGSTRLPGKFHKDPADRILVALARRHGVPLVTSDSRIRSYQHVHTIW